MTPTTAIQRAEHWRKEGACGEAAKVDIALLNELESTKQNSIRYVKLRRWMGSNVDEGWKAVEHLGAVCAWMGWDEMDAMLDDMPECNFGLSRSRLLSDMEKNPELK
ncbi:hypothetical protein [Herbaspirillum sp. CAH-3]|uniref:hypothetical protein n=1 Tax=Herbaspirillum sp. CAH-3 TaxID=2605746 RepID=UPI0012AC8D19|nr:hypothetical protein [Herbaspirillum sp. CAH-3]MRT30776.1 hypothetical protein [Herbaspirillum sp. CAH-3]